MSSTKLNRWPTLLANLALLIGILLVLVELNQNRQATRAQTRSELSMGLVAIQSGIAENSQLADVLAKAGNGEPLTPGERIQFRNRNIAMYRYWENVHYQYREGLYDDEEFTKQRDAWGSYVNSSESVTAVWCEIRDTFSTKFAAAVNALLDKFNCE